MLRWEGMSNRDQTGINLVPSGGRTMAPNPGKQREQSHFEFWIKLPKFCEPAFP